MLLIALLLWFLARAISGIAKFICFHLCKSMTYSPGLCTNALLRAKFRKCGKIGTFWSQSILGRLCHTRQHNRLLRGFNSEVHKLELLGWRGQLSASYRLFLQQEMPPMSHYQQLTYEQRCQIEALKKSGMTQQCIADTANGWSTLRMTFGYSEIGK